MFCSVYQTLLVVQILKHGLKKDGIYNKYKNVINAINIYFLLYLFNMFNIYLICYML